MKVKRYCYIVGGCLAVAVTALACGGDGDTGTGAPRSEGMTSGGGGSAGSEQGTGGGSATGGTEGIAGSRPGGTGGASSGGTAGSETGGTAGSGGASGEQSGGSSGTPSGGSSGTPTGGSSGASAGSGGASGGTAGQGGTGGATGATGGAAGSGGTVVLDPPGPGIACGEETCDEESEMCCVGESDRWCSTSQCSNSARLECDDSADCPGERCCYTNIMESNRIMTFCSSDCGMWLGPQVCKEAGDCDSGETCHAFACGGFDTVMYIDTVPNRNSRPCILLRESYRQGKKVKKRTVANLTDWPDHLVEGLRSLLKGGKPIEDLSGGFDITESRPYGHVAAVLSFIGKLGLDKIIASRRSRVRDLILAMIVARILDPASKLATARGLNSAIATSALGDILRLNSPDEDELYQAMDWLATRQGHIENSLARKHLSDGSLILYDVSSTYFEGRKCPLAKRGHSRDGKKGKLQIVFGLLCNEQGCPVAVEVFPGNTGDPSTLSNQIEKLRTRFGLERVIIVGDRGMITQARIDEELSDTEGLDWISALRAPAIAKLLETKSLQLSLFDETDLAEIEIREYQGKDQ